MPAVWKSNARRLALCTAMALLTFGAPPLRAQTLEEIIDANIEATGGKDKIMGLKSVRRLGDIKLKSEAFGEMAGKSETIIVPYKKSYWKMDFGIFNQTMVWAGGSTGWVNGLAGLKDAKGPELTQTKLQALIICPLLSMKYGLMDEEAPKLTKLDDEELDGKMYYVIEADTPAMAEMAGSLQSTAGSKIKLYVDSETKLHTITSFSVNNEMLGGEMDLSFRMSDYQDYDGVKLPGKLTMIAGTLANVEWTFTETEVNGELDESIFDKPEPPAPPGPPTAAGEEAPAEAPAAAEAPAP